jgi:hypothetical protein
VSICTVSDVLGDAAQLLGDPERQVFEDDILLNRLGTAWRDMYRLMDKWNLPSIKLVAYYNLAAYRNILTPETAGIANMGTPTRLRERGNLTTTTISAATNTSPIVLTVADGSSFSDNDEATVHGVVGPTGRINGKWFISVNGNSITLNGSVKAGTWASGGTLTKSSDDFTEMTNLERLSQQDPIQYLREWVWREDVFWFRGSTEERQLKIEYESSGAAPVAGDVGIDDARDFLAHRTAALAAATRGFDGRAKDLMFLAVGKSGQCDGSGGLLFDLMKPMLMEKQKRPKRPMAFRARRSHHAWR